MKTTLRPQSSDASAHASAERSDEELLAAYRDKGDRRAFDTLVHRYENELYRYLHRFLGDGAMAEDAFQTTFLQVHLKCDQFDTKRRFRPWLYTVATNQAIDTQRRNKRHQSVSLDRGRRQDAQSDEVSLVDLLVHDDQGPVSELEQMERRNWVREAVANLPEQLRSAVLLIYFQGLKYREAAEALSIPVGTVKSRLHTAIMKLNEAWTRGELSKEA
ncbi:MAG: sigma-70 family RNA polymerase sigma factor [Pirellulales bacterium]|nr:sigma-70 family RNA polymerase sigma factor [Planctomycetales bacterium]